MATNTTTIGSFKGLDNINAPESLAEFDRTGRSAATYLAEATNVDITRTGRAVRRQGFSLSVAGRCHSLWWSPESDLGFVVKDERLGLIDSSLTFTDLRASSQKAMSYADTGAGIYMSDNQFMGRYRDGALVELAKAGDYSPSRSYLDPSEDSDTYDAPPTGNLLMWMFGRLWVANNDAVFYSRGYFPDQFNLAYDYIDEPGVTLLAPVTDGFYIGTDKKVQFVASTNPKDPARVTTVLNCGAVARTQIITDSGLFGLDGAPQPAVVFESQEGKILGLAGGRVVKLTDNHVAYPAGDKGASMMRQANGEIFHVSSIAARDSDSSNMRTTDTAVAEVIRNGITI